MLFSFKRLALGVTQNEETKLWSRPATGEHEFANTKTDDVVVPDDNVGEFTTYAIMSLSQLRKEFWSQLACTYMLTVTLWICAAITLWRTMAAYLLSGFRWYTFLVPAIFVALAALFTPQSINPTVRDSNHKWVNLRTGYSNLNGKSILLKKV